MKKINKESLRGQNNTVNTCGKTNKPNSKEMCIQVESKQRKENENRETNNNFF